MQKKIQYIKSNKYTLMSATLPLFLIFIVGFGVLWSLEKRQSIWLEERGFESIEDYSEYRDKQQDEINKLSVDISKIKADMVEYMGESYE